MVRPTFIQVCKYDTPIVLHFPQHKLFDIIILAEVKGPTVQKEKAGNRIRAGYCPIVEIVCLNPSEIHIEMKP